MAEETNMLTLLTAGGDPPRRILKYVSEGPEGLQSVLAVREVSSSARNWVDNSHSPPYDDLRIESAVAAVKSPPVTLRDPEFREAIQTILTRFQAAPPPPFVTHLKFSSVFPPELTDEIERRNWECFLDHWQEKITHLDITTLELPFSPRLHQFFAAESLREVNFGRIIEDNGANADQIEFPSFFKHVRSLRIGHYDGRFDFTSLYESLKVNRSLKHLQVVIESKEESRLLGQLLRLKRNDRSLNVRISVRVIVAVSRRNDGLYLAQKILKSSSNIELFDVIPEGFQWLCNRLSDEETKVIMSMVISISWWRRIPDCPLRSFYKLRFIGVHSCVLYEEQERLPFSLEVTTMRISLDYGFRHAFLRRQLVKLNLVITDRTVNLSWFAAMIQSVSRSTPNLRHLGVYMNSVLRDQRYEPRDLPAMSTLTSMEFMCLNVPWDVRRCCLIRILGMDRMERLKRLVLSPITPGRFPVVEPAEEETVTMEQMMAGPLANTLTQFELIYRFAPTEFHHQLEPIYAAVVRRADLNAAASNRESQVHRHHTHVGDFCDSLTCPPARPPYYR